MGKALVGEENKHSLTPMKHRELVSAPHTGLALGRQEGPPACN